MKFKKLSAVLACAMIVALPVRSSVSAVDETALNSVSAVETENSTRAAGLISSYTLSCSSGKAKTLYITGATRGTEMLAKIGFKNIKIQRSSDKSTWTTEKTISDQIDKDTDYKSLAKYAVTVEGGYYYRVVLDHYAKEDKLLFPDTQTVNNTSNIVWVSKS